MDIESEQGGQQQNPSLEGNDPYVRLFDISLDLLSVAGTDGYFRKLNRAWERVTGWSMEELLARPLIEFVHPDDRPFCQRNLEAVFSGRDVVSCENRFQCKDGSYRWLSWTCPGVTAGLDTIYTVARDVTDRHEAEQKATQSEAIIQAAFNNFPFDLWIMNQEGKHVLQNQVCFKRWGHLMQVPPEQWPVTEATKKKWLLNNERALKGEVVLGEVAYQHQGELMHVYNILAPIWVQGKQHGYLGINIDVTEQRRAEEALRHSEKQFRQLVETARDVIAIISPEGHFISLNGALENSTGWQAHEWIGKHFSEVIPEEAQAEAFGYFQRALSGERLPLFELPIRTRHGGVITLEVTITPQMEEGKVTGLLGIGRDVTVRKLMEHEIRQLQKMESIGQLAAGVAHDFNNILTVVQGNISLMLATAPEEGQRELMEQIMDVSQRAANLTRQLLAFSRKQMMQPRSVNLNEVTSQMTKMLDRILGEDVTLEFHYDAALPNVKADPSMMEQVILNLAINARDAMPNGGVLRISTEVVDVSPQYCRQKHEARLGRFVSLGVTDTGGGITPENLPLIFEPFFTTKEFGKGTGLGLATVYGIIKQHHGWVDVESEMGRGSVFRIFLPVSETASPLANLVTEERIAKKGAETILVVEDDHTVRRMIETILAMAGYQVNCAASGNEALEVWEHCGSKVNLLLTDMVMPGGMNGKELAVALRLKRADLRVLISSGYSSALVDEGQALPPKTWFLAKPYTPDELLRQVRVCLDE